jgi:hypothetical protein
MLWWIVYGSLAAVALLSVRKALIYRKRVKELTEGEPTIDFEVTLAMIESDPDGMFARLQGKVAGVLVCPAGWGNARLLLLDANAREHDLAFEGPSHEGYDKADWIAQRLGVEVRDVATFAGGGGGNI